MRSTVTKRLLASLALAALLVGAPAAQREGEPVDPRALTLSKLLLDAESGRTPRELGERLIALGSSFVAPMFDAVATRRLLVLDEREEVRQVALDGRHEALLRGALAQSAPDAVRAHLHRVAFDGATRDERDLVLQLLVGVGTEADVPVLLLAGEPEAGERRPSRAVVERFQLAAQGLLGRCETVPLGLQDAFAEVHPALVAPLVRAVAGQGTRAALEGLAGLLGVVAEADGLLLLELGRLAESVPPPYHRTVRDAVRARLRRNDVEELLRAVDVVAKLEDREALPRLVELLEHPATAVAKQADVALVRLTRQDLGGNRDRWEDWYARTMRWWNEDAPKMIDDLRDGEPGDASRALLELSKQRVFRHDLVDPVAECLGRPEDELVLLACAVLGHLGSWRAVPILVERLDDPDVKVQAEAIRALQRITGLAHRDAAPWRELARRDS